MNWDNPGIYDGENLYDTGTAENGIMKHYMIYENMITMGFYLEIIGMFHVTRAPNFMDTMAL